MQWYKQTDNMFYDTDNYRYWQERDRKVKEREDRLRQPLKGENPVRPYKPDPRNQRPRPMGPKDYGSGPVIDNETGRKVPPPKSPYGRAVDTAKRHLGKPTLGRALRPFLRRLSPLDKIEFLEWLYREWERNGGKYPYPLPNPAAGWVRGGKCPSLATNGFQISTSNNQGAAHPWNSNANNCLGGQAATPAAIGSPLSFSQRQLNYLRNTNGQTGTAARYAHTDAFWRANAGNNITPDFVPSWSLGRDPNVQRWMDPFEQPFEAGQPFGEPAPQTGIGSPMTEPVPFYSDSSPYDPDHHWKWHTGLGTGTALTPGTTIPTPGGTRIPPRFPDREGKVMSRAARVGIALYRALDSISEWSEVVDAIYEALPDDVKKRWSRDRRPGDNFGQYGIDGADWKLAALYYNWHKVDFEQAVKNVLKNQLSDAAIGRMQAGLPRNTGAAHEGGEKEFAKWLDSVFDEVLNQ